MAKPSHIILAVHITDRLKKVPQVQKALSAYGCFIKTRLGLHEAAPGFCSANGLLILEMLPDGKKAAALAKALGRVKGIEVRKIVFTR